MKSVVYTITTLLLIVTFDCYAFNDPDKLYKIDFPKGWEVIKDTTRTGENYYQARHPRFEGTIAVHAFNNPSGKKETDYKIDNDTADNMAIELSLKPSRKTKSCPSPPQLIFAKKVVLGNAKGVRDIITCGPYYYDETFYFGDGTIYQLLATYNSNSNVMDTLNKSIDSFRILKTK